MEQQENQYNIEAKEKKQNKIFFTGLFWGFIFGGIFACISIGVIRIVYTSYQNSNVIEIPETKEEGNNNKEHAATDSAITSQLIQKLRTLESAIDVYYYQDGINYEDLQTGMLTGMIDALNDPYSEYYTKEELEEVNRDNEGIYYGIGAYVSMDTELSMPKISGVIANTPAEEAGLRENDVITAVGDVSMYQKTTQDAVSYIRGEEGTTVTLTIYRPSEQEYIDITEQYEKLWKQRDKLEDEVFGKEQ